MEWSCDPSRNDHVICNIDSRETEVDTGAAEEGVGRSNVATETGEGSERDREMED